MCLIRITIANLCPNMIHLDALDFSKCRSAEVICFFWRSVYVCMYVCMRVSYDLYEHMYGFWAGQTGTKDLVMVKKEEKTLNIGPILTQFTPLLMNTTIDLKYISQVIKS